jgi:hypothetical protein
LSSNGKTMHGSNTAGALAFDYPDSDILRHAGAQCDSLRVLGDKGRAHLGGLGGEAGGFLGVQLPQSRLLEDRQRRAGSDAVENLSFGCDRSAACPVLGERRVEHRRALKYEAFRRADDAVDDRALEQLATGPDHQPAQPGEPASRVQCL